MKKLLAILLACAMVLGLAACASNNNPSTKAPDTSTAPAGDDNATGTTDGTSGAKPFKYGCPLRDGPAERWKRRTCTRQRQW